MISSSDNDQERHKNNQDFHSGCGHSYSKHFQVDDAVKQFIFYHLIAAIFIRLFTIFCAELCSWVISTLPTAWHSHHKAILLVVSCFAVKKYKGRADPHLLSCFHGEYLSPAYQFMALFVCRNFYRILDGLAKNYVSVISG